MGFTVKSKVLVISGEFITVRAASEINGYNQQYLRRLLRKGLFKTRKIGQIWLIDQSEFVAYLSEATQTTDKRFGPQYSIN
jgi:hypothetical protein